MRAIRRGGADVQLVIAAQRGDRTALEKLLAQYLPLLYNIVGRAMNGHADADDVVQETMLRAVRNIGDLRDPAAFRSWLVAVAVRQVRDYVAARQPQVTRDPAAEVADPGADFVDVTILRLGLSGQRRETAEATRWLDHEDREVLALWWQEAAGTLDRSAVASGLGMTPAHTAVRIGRMKDRLTTARQVVRALGARPPCAGLAEAITGWDYAPSPLWRKRVARHVRECERCGAHLADMVPAEHLLNGLPLVPAPLLAIPLAAAARHLAPGQRALPHRAPHPHALPQHVAAARHLRLLPKVAASFQPKVVAAVAATGCVAAGAVIVARVHSGPVKTPPARTLALQPRTTITIAAAPSPAPPRRPRHRSRPAPAVVTSTMKGVSAWTFPGVSQALAQSGASWYYTWSTSHSGIASPPGVGFVPMIRAAGDVTSAELGQARSESNYLMGFNEPDLASQANMSVAQALSLWPQLMATGMQLGSPAVADNAATPGSWLDLFMQGAAARGYRVNFINVHWYGGNFVTSAAVSELRSYLQAIYQRYHLPIWITELGLVNYGGSPMFPTDGQQAAFLTAATSMLASLGYVQRYAWFALPVSSGDGNMGLFASGPVVTQVGRAFEAAGG